MILTKPSRSTRNIRNIRSNQASRKIRLSPSIRNSRPVSRRILRRRNNQASRAIQCRHIPAKPVSLSIRANPFIPVKPASRERRNFQDNPRFQGSRAFQFIQDNRAFPFIQDNQVTPEHRQFPVSLCNTPGSPFNIRASRCHKILRSRSPSISSSLLNIQASRRSIPRRREVIRVFLVLRRGYQDSSLSPANLVLPFPGCRVYRELRGPRIRERPARRIRRRT